MMKNGSKAFTLIELSVSLVIIVLLVSGVLVGRTLLRQSEVSAAMADAQNYISATQSFIKKYNALPGDMANATTYWGAAAGSSPYTVTCYDNGAGTPPATCNGSGDGQINNTGNFASEALISWQHLAAAGFVSGTYSGQSKNGSLYGAIGGVNSPAGKMANLAYQIAWQGILASNSYAFDGNYGHIMYLGGYYANNPPIGATFTGTEAQSLDTKFDDGSPALGNLRTWKNGAYGLTCASSTAVTATYSTNASSKVCSLMMITGF